MTDHDCDAMRVLRAWGEARRRRAGAMDHKAALVEEERLYRVVRALADCLAAMPTTIEVPVVPVDVKDERVVDALVSKATSRSVARRLAAQRGEPPPRFDAPPCARCGGSGSVRVDHCAPPGGVAYSRSEPCPSCRGGEGVG